MKNIKSLFWPGGETRLTATSPGEIVEDVDGLGVSWAVRRDSHGNVIARHNLRYVETVIYWPVSETGGAE